MASAALARLMVAKRLSIYAQDADYMKRRNQKSGSTRKPVDPQALFRHACMFVNSADFMKRSGAMKSVETGFPLLVLEAFSIELLLKCLLLLERKEIPQSHRLAVLFRRIGSKTKRRIVDGWEAEARPMLTRFGREKNLPTDLPNALVQCDRAFEQLRYGYEDPAAMVFYLGGLPPILIDAVKSLKDDWVIYTDE